MKQYKVEFVEVTRNYTSVNVDAENKHLAISKAKTLSEEQLEEKETTTHIAWEARTQVNFIANLINFLKGK